MIADPLVLLEDLKSRFASDWSAEDRDLLQKVGADMMNMLALKTAGHPMPESESRHIEAAAVSLAAGAEMTGLHVIGEWIAAIARKLLAAAI